MKRFLVVLPLLVLLALPSHASAKVSDAYFGLKAAYSSITSDATLNYTSGREFDYDDSYGAVGIGGVFGATLAKMNGVNLRFELEALFRFGKGELEESSQGEELEIHTNSSLLAGLYLDFPIADTVTPYAGVVLGASIFGYESKSYLNTSRTSWVKENGSGAAFQYGLGGGLAFKVNRKMSIDLGARYLWSTDYNIDYDGIASNWDIDVNNKILDVSLGFRYHF